MNKLLTIIAACGCAAAASAQTLNVQLGHVTYAFAAEQTGVMPFAEGSTLTVQGRTFALAEVSQVYVDYTPVADNTVSVRFDGTEASVVVAGNVAQYVDVAVDGANVAVAQSALVSDDTCGEIKYTLTGSSADGSFCLAGEFKATVTLSDLNLTSLTAAPLSVQNGKRIKFKVPDGTASYLADAPGGSHKGCLACTGHSEFSGGGSLTIACATGHAIYSKEYIELKNTHITITSAAKDGINCNQYFTMESGAVSIANVGDDGLQVSFKDDADREPEDTATATISGGSFTAEVSATAAKGIKADGDVNISGGEFIISVSGGGEWDADDLKTKAAACIGADGNITVDGGTFTLSATGGGGKGFNADGNFTLNDGSITITTSGGVVVYSNGTLSQNYTGNLDRIDSDYKSSPKGIKADGAVEISGGSIHVQAAHSEGIESKSTLTINGGEVFIHAYDDAINSASHLTINGGTVTAIASNNDGIDSNGHIYINGGTVMAFGARSIECGLDANSESGYTVFFTGGTLLAVGGNNSLPTTAASTQPFVTTSLSVTANTTVTVKNGTTELTTFTIPAEYGTTLSAPGAPGGPGGGGAGSTSAAMVITAPTLTNGTSYTITSGSSTATATAKLR